MKPHIHFHSDCQFFAGCENMLVCLFGDEYFKNNYRTTFSYRFTPRYMTGFAKRVTKKPKTNPLKLFEPANIVERFSAGPIKKLVKIVYYLFLIKYFCIFWNAVMLFRFFNRKKIDLLHINNGGYPGANSCMSALIAARFLGIKKVVYVVNNIAVPYKHPSRWLDFPFDRFAARYVSIFITGSIFAGQSLKKVLGLPDSKMAAVHNGIVCRKLTESKEKVLKRLGINQNRLLVAVVAVIEGRKGHIYLLKALKILKNRYGKDNLPLILIEGCGCELASLVKYADKEGLNDDVVFVGDESNVFNLINAVDVIALPSISNEDFPNVILEAMSLGKVVIASRLSGIPEQIVDGDSGILFEPKDVEGIADILRRLLDNDDLRVDLGRNAKKRFEGKFTARTAVEKYQKLYVKLLEECR